ncbi:hypothetical protein ES703_121064 [subsurface metagenome]
MVWEQVYGLRSNLLDALSALWRSGPLALKKVTPYFRLKTAFLCRGLRDPFSASFFIVAQWSVRCYIFSRGDLCQVRPLLRFVSLIFPTVASLGLLEFISVSSIEPATGFFYNRFL